MMIKFCLFQSGKISGNGSPQAKFFRGITLRLLFYQEGDRNFEVILGLVGRKNDWFLKIFKMKFWWMNFFERREIQPKFFAGLPRLWEKIGLVTKKNLG